MKKLLQLAISVWVLQAGLSLAAGPAPRDKQPQMLSRWAKDVSPKKVLSEYPRPQMVRPEWLNLNGLWQYAVTHRDKTNSGSYQGHILVPFPVESAFSGVNRFFNEQQRLWYQRRFSVPANWRSRRVLLHFGAVDWEARIWINGKELGTHRGGFDAFSFDITDALKPEAEQELVVSVYDPTEGGYQPRGKQMLHPHDSFYSACSGILQTVWLEPVAAVSLEALKLEPDVDAGQVSVAATLRGDSSQVTLEAVACEGQKEVARVIYLHLPRYDTIVLFYLYTKAQSENLSPEQLRRLREAATIIKEEFRG